MKRHTLLALALAAAAFSNSAAADDSICFINNSSHTFTLIDPNDGEAVFVLNPNVGDTNTCVDVPTIDGNSVQGDSAASYYEPGWQVDNVSFSLDSTYLVQGQNIRPFNTIPEVAGLTEIQPVFLNPVIGEGTFYWANKWLNGSGNELDGDITWQEGDLWCTVPICFFHQRGDDGIYRVVLGDNELEMPEPPSTAPSNPTNDGPIPGDGDWG